MIRRSSFLHRQSGFTLIEMIGVLAIIAILIAAISPRIFDAISDSRITGCASVVKSVQTAVSKYYTDIGTLLPLTPAGVGAVDAAGAALPNILTGITAVPAPVVGLWANFRAYLEKFSAANPPLGDAMNMPVVMGVAGAANAAISTNFDLNGDGTNDFSATGQVVSLTLTGVSDKEFAKLDRILDGGIGTTAAEQQARGKVKWAGGTVRIYIADK